MIYIVSDPASTPLTGRATALALLTIVAVPLIVWLAPMAWRFVGLKASPLPLRCASGEDLVVRNQKYKSSDSTPVIFAQAGCRLRLINTTLEGDIVLRAEANSEVVIESSELIGRKSGIEVLDGAQILIQGKSKIRAPIGVIAGAGSTTTIDDSAIVAEEIGIKADMAPVINLRNHASVTGKNIAIQTRQSLELNLSDGQIESATDALVAESSARINAKRSVIRGGRRAFALSSAPQLLSTDSTQIEGAQVFDRR